VKPTFRLDSVSPTLADLFRQAPAERRRHAALIACEQAASASGLIGKSVTRAFEALKAERSIDASSFQELEKLAADLDEQYLGAAEGSEVRQGGEALRLFSLARAASALVLASSTDHAQLHESLYEAISALEFPVKLIHLLEEALR